MLVVGEDEDGDTGVMFMVDFYPQADKDQALMECSMNDADAKPAVLHALGQALETARDA